MTLMVIFGAGGSYDSSAVYLPNATTLRTIAQGRPPLAKDLFDTQAYANQVRQHNMCRALFPELRNIPRGSSIEQRLEELTLQAEQDDHIARALLALRSYLAAVINTSTANWFNLTSGVTNYVAIVSRLATWRKKGGETVYFVTFNYDTLLEQACQDVLGLRFTDMASYIGHPSFKVLKPHGSTNWQRQMSGAGFDSLDSVRTCQLLDGYLGPGENMPGGPATVEAVAVPTLTKSGFECPSSHRDELRTAVGTATRLLVIGWRGAEKHFLDLWANRGAIKLDRIQIVTGSQEGAAEVKDNLRRADIVSDDTRLFGGGFSKFLDAESDGLGDFLYCD